MKLTAISILLALVMTSCFSYTVTVGSGAKGHDSVSKWNPYFIDGLIPGTQVDPKQLSQGATDYTITTKFSIGNMLVSALTIGIYTPTTVTVTK